MCGICGFVQKDRKFEAKDRLSRMNAVMANRGPDDEGYFWDQDAGLAMRRLSIVDLEGGRQPIHNEDKTVWCVANAEIYNFRELTGDLQSRGHVFYTKSDVEAVVHSYEEWGLDFASKLRGMFAIALWDQKQKRLVLARDRIGIKPLLYTKTPQGIFFSSESRSFRGCPGFKAEVDMQSAYMYFSLNYVIQPRSIYSNVFFVRPAHCLVYENNSIKELEYWQINSTAEKTLQKNEIDEALQDAVSSHLIGDVPLGIFLSGGIDSSILLRHFSKFQGNITAFSIGFSETSFDETPFAAIVAKKYGARHITETIDAKKCFEELPAIISGLDEPMADSSIIGVHFLSKLARQHVKAVLTGEGGDEVFGGYETYTADTLAPVYRKFPAALRSVLKKSVNSMPVSEEKVTFGEKLRRFVKYADLDGYHPHLFWRRIFDCNELAKLFKDRTFEVSDNVFDVCCTDHYKAMDDIKGTGRYKFFDIKTYLPSDMLVKIDRAGMANSLEARVPLLDHYFIEKAFQSRNKDVLRQILSEELPDSITKRRKAGFNMPINSWLKREKQLKDLLFDSLNTFNRKGSFRFDMDYVEKLHGRHVCGREDNGYKLYNLIVYALWSNSLAN